MDMTLFFLALLPIQQCLVNTSIVLLKLWSLLVVLPWNPPMKQNDEKIRFTTKQLHVMNDQML